MQFAEMNNWSGCFLLSEEVLHVKRIISYIILVALLCSVISIGSIATVFDASIATNVDLLNFISEISPLLFDDEQFIAANSKIFLGERIPLFRVAAAEIVAADYDMYPIFMADELIATINVGYDNDNVPCYSFTTDIAHIKDVITEQPCALVYDTAGLNIIKNDMTVTFAQPMVSSGLHDDLSSVANLSNITFTQARPTIEICSVPTSRSSSAAESNIINLTPLGNTELPCCDGICWASCGATLANRYGDSSEYTALSYHNSVDCDLYGYDYHYYGEEFLNEKGVRTQGYYYSDPTYSIIKAYIDDDSLALLDLQEYGVTEEPAAHNVIACGYSTINSGAQLLSYMDPNSGTHTTMFHSDRSILITTSGFMFEIHCYLRCLD